ncbi:beta-lactamase class C [Aquimarina sp. EL_43]|uniref:serine hydrolase domain-containing protein n=1 Tax=Aquimarina TaxID=290174 RepID=UPI0004700E17|nr:MULTISPECIES: serine hydrolase domain-containing protein [Aquimarina]MBG6133005.1 beta-lactamase class C [Aquimarina sp. EL_35]MBG6152316.1 beta-lactamase class C [Aquimarina sp. EL_32]MBG6171154.1 beta-lactamase class C [Aquimarina sp. EL_43]
MKYFYAVFALVFLVSCTTSKPKERVVVIDEKPEVSKKDSISFFLEHYEKFFATNFNVSECPGAAVVVVKGDTVIYKKGFGVKEIHTQDSVDLNTVFRIASLSKGVTAVLAGNLVDRDELQWDQNVRESVKTFSLRNSEQADRLKVNHLLSHTTGLYPYTYTKLIQKGWSLEQIIRSFKRKGVVSKEGVDYEYQNAIFSVIEKIMENQTEKSFETLLKERVFAPAGMHTASSTYAAIRKNDNVALPHKYNHYSKKYKVTEIHKNYYNVTAAGGINASISDMGEYLKVLLGYRPDIISKESLSDIFNPIICTSNEDTYVNLWDGVTDSYYAMGWRVLDYRGRRILYHGGNVNQYKTQLLIDPDNDIGVCVLFNGPNPFNGPVIPTFLNYYDFYKEISQNQQVK